MLKLLVEAPSLWDGRSCPSLGMRERLGNLVYATVFLREHWDRAFPRKRNTCFVSSLQSQVGSPVKRRCLETIAQRCCALGSMQGGPVVLVVK